MFQKINSFFTSKKNSNLINEISNKYLKKINQLESQISKLTREEMISQIEGMKQKKINDNISELSEEDISYICAITREASNRTISLRHYDSQIIGGIALYLVL